MCECSLQKRAPLLGGVGDQDDRGSAIVTLRHMVQEVARGFKSSRSTTACVGGGGMGLRWFEVAPSIPGGSEWVEPGPSVLIECE